MRSIFAFAVILFSLSAMAAEPPSNTVEDLKHHSIGIVCATGTDERQAVQGVNVKIEKILAELNQSLIHRSDWTQQYELKRKSIPTLQKNENSSAACVAIMVRYVCFTMPVNGNRSGICL